MSTVLVTGVGGATGIGLTKALHEETDHRVVGVDMDPDAAGLHLADVGRAVPPAANEAWARTVAEVVTAHDIDVVVPTVDEELGRLPALSAALPDETPVVAPRQDVIDDSLDKYRTYERLAEAGHAVPKTRLATETETLGPADFPLLVKPRRGRGSRGIRRVESRAELDAHLDSTDYAREELLVQEFVTGTEYTTGVVATADNRLLAVVPKEAIEKDGSTTKGVTRRAPAVSESCRAIFETLQPGGPINVQQILTDDGEPYTIEINPRFSSTTCLTVAAGVNGPDLLVRDALGESVSPPDDFEAGLAILRYPDHVFVSRDEETHSRSSQEPPIRHESEQVSD